MKKFRESLPHVAVLLRCTWITNRELIKGLLEYTRIEEPWTLSISTCHYDDPGEIDFDAIHCAGIVTDKPGPSILDYARRRHVPIITVLQKGQVSPEVIANVTCDKARGHTPRERGVEAFRIRRQSLVLCLEHCQTRRVPRGVGRARL